MDIYKNYEVWLVAGSQHLYGPKTLEQVAANSREIAGHLNSSKKLSIPVNVRTVVTTADEISIVCREANAAPNCIGLICWMHTFSPAKMWIAGLRELTKPFLHFHTQFNREIPWNTIDMDFMNLNQSAHGDREFGFIGTRMQKRRKVIVGHWQDPEIHEEIDCWMRAAVTNIEMQNTRVARFGDNMRDVAVTEGNKVSAQIELGFSVHGYGVGDLVHAVNTVDDESVDILVAQYMEEYEVSKKLRNTKEFSQLREAAKVEVGLRNFLTSGGFRAFTTNFEDLHGLQILPGLACQRLMNDGYGFGAEGDWKTAALVRAMKIMGAGREGGTSFMEDYTYHIPEKGPAMVLGAHMLEVCPSIAESTPSLEIHPLSIGGKADPARLVFTAKSGPAINATLIDLGTRFRMLVNGLDVVAPEHAMPHLPVARAFWVPQPDLKVSASAWILGGGAHHTGFSQAITRHHLQDYCEMLNIEFLVIDAETTTEEFKKELRYNHLYYALMGVTQ